MTTFATVATPLDVPIAPTATGPITAAIETVGTRIDRCAAAYADLPVFRVVRTDRVPVDRFPDFFREQAVAARFFQDLIWAATDIHTPELAAFAAAHRKVDSGHYRWSEHDLESTNQRPLTINDCFALEFLETRIQMARMLAVFHDASPTERLVALCALETAGTITLGTLFGYVTRHGLDHVLYLGKPHVHIEENQVEGLRERLGAVLLGHEPRLLAIVDTIFDALTCMFARGGARHWADLLEAA
jgi:hypothetical protein